MFSTRSLWFARILIFILVIILLGSIISSITFIIACVFVCFPFPLPQRHWTAFFNTFRVRDSIALFYSPFCISFSSPPDCASRVYFLQANSCTVRGSKLYTFRLFSSHQLLSSVVQFFFLVSSLFLSFQASSMYFSENEGIY